MANVVEQRGDPDQDALVAVDQREVVLILEQRERSPRQVVRSERVLEPRVSGSRIDEEGQPELANVPQPLEGRCVDQLETERIEPDVVPERVTDDFHGHVAYDTWAGTETREPNGCERKPLSSGSVVLFMLTPAPTQAKAPVAQTPTAPPPAPTTVLPGPASSIAVLQEQVASLSQQLAGLRAERTILQRQINRASDGTLRAALELKQVPIENQIAQVEIDLASARAQLASRQGTETQPPFVFPPGARRQFDPDLAAGLAFAFIFAVMMPMSIAMARRVWRGSPKAVAPRADDVIAPRLDRLEQAVDAIAIEVERISEGQRFVTRVLAERPAAAPAQPHAAQTPKEAPAMGDGKPIRALGAGPAEPIRAAERQAVRQSITPL